METPVEMHCIVTGLVQGVCFRATTRKLALMLDLVGTVKNLPDSSVEIYAVGPKSKLENLLALLKTDASPARVDTFTTRFYPAKQTYPSFSIIY